jgi:hypothetical protein
MSVVNATRVIVVKGVGTELFNLPASTHFAQLPFAERRKSSAIALFDSFTASLHGLPTIAIRIRVYRLCDAGPRA